MGSWQGYGALQGTYCDMSLYNTSEQDSTFVFLVYPPRLYSHPLLPTPQACRAPKICRTRNRERPQHPRCSAGCQLVAALIRPEATLTAPDMTRSDAYCSHAAHCHTMANKRSLVSFHGLLAQYLDYLGPVVPASLWRLSPYSYQDPSPSIL